MSRRTYAVGDLVRYTGKHLRSIGLYTAPINGKVVGFSTLRDHKTGAPFPLVWWSDREQSDVCAVHPANIEPCKR